MSALDIAAAGVAAAGEAAAGEEAYPRIGVIVLSQYSDAYLREPPT
jgi:hypothetical protein